MDINKNKEEVREETLNPIIGLLEDYFLTRTDPAEFARRENIRDYDNAKKQIEAMQPITFGHAVNILLLTDRLHGCAKGLLEYLSNSTDITVNLVNDLEAVQRMAEQAPLDFLIIVGMLHHTETYKSIQAVKKANTACIIMYAVIDGIIQNICAQNGIAHMYNRYLPMEAFVSYLSSFFIES